MGGFGEVGAAAAGGAEALAETPGAAGAGLQPPGQPFGPVAGAFGRSGKGSGAVGGLPVPVGAGARALRHPAEAGAESRCASFLARKAARDGRKRVGRPFQRRETGHRGDPGVAFHPSLEGGHRPQALPGGDRFLAARDDDFERRDPPGTENLLDLFLGLTPGIVLGQQGGNAEVGPQREGPDAAEEEDEEHR
jgi:hypothetical protein